MANMSIKKNPMPTQKTEIRRNNFDEVVLSYEPEQAADKEKHCLRCKK